MIKRFIPYYKPHFKLFAFDMFCALTVSAIDLVFPLISRQFINVYIPNQNIDKMLNLSMMVGGVFLVRMFCYYFMAYWGHVVGARMEHDMRRDLYRHIQRLPFTYFDENKTGQIMARLVGDLSEVAELAHHGPEDLFISVLMLLGSFLLLLTINVPLTLLVFFFVLLLVLFTVSRRKMMMRAFKSVRKKHAEINANVENSISGIRLAKSFANEAFEIEKFAISNMEHRESKKDAFRAMGIFSSGTHFMADMIGLIVIAAGGIFVAYGWINIGDLVAYLLYTAHFIRPVRRLIQFTQQYQSGMAGFNRFIEIMDIVPAIVDSDNAKELTDIKGEIHFEKVDFKYDDKTGYIFKDFDLQIRAGQCVALVGPSGVGKTTISHLIPRFYDISEGSISLDGENIKELTLNSLRSHIGLVQQDVFIFYGSIYENILYGNPDADEEDVIESAKKANIHDFIMSLPEGYDSLVGERGVKLSGGQKQRISIARVFLKNPPILILDEATSSLDNATELAIQEAIEILAKERTTLIIAHRLSTIRNADDIIVLDDNKIAERGNHHALIELDGIYASLYRAQFDGFMPDTIESKKNII